MENESKRDKWAIDWDDCDGGDEPGDEDLMDIFIDIVHTLYIK